MDQPTTRPVVAVIAGCAAIAVGTVAGLVLAAAVAVVVSECFDAALIKSP